MGRLEGRGRVWPTPREEFGMSFMSWRGCSGASGRRQDEWEIDGRCFSWSLDGVVVLVVGGLGWLATN